jgi:hypothetical protein
MVINVSDIAPQLQTLFGADAEKAAKEAKLIQRKRKVTAPAFAQGLVFAWMGNPLSTGDELIVALARAGIDMKEQSLDDRFTPEAAEFFRLLLNAALRKVIATYPHAKTLLCLFEGVFLLDSTTISLPAALAGLFPGCGGTNDAPACQAAMKVMVRYEVGSGVIEGLSLHPGRTSDVKTELHQADLPPGALRLADMGFFDLDVLRDYDAKRAYFITRPLANTVIYDERGRRWRLARYLGRKMGDRVDTNVWVGAGRQLRCRLLAIRAPVEVVEKRRKQAREQAVSHGNAVSEDKLELCGWTVFLTNVPGWMLSLQEVWVLYRVRWQIELLFKLWKSDGKIDESRSTKPYRVLCEVYAKLLGMVVQHWLLLRCGGAGLGKKSVRKAARAVRQQIGHVAAVLFNQVALVAALAVMARMVAAAGDIHRRRRRPATYQTLFDPDHDGLSEGTTSGPNPSPPPQTP